MAGSEGEDDRVCSQSGVSAVFEVSSSCYDAGAH